MPALSRNATLGALIGCAVGDAMGAPFEGLWPESIPSPDLLRSGYHEYHGYPSGQYTDDTQLTLATVESIVAQGEISLPDVARCISELWRHQSVIGPGGACTHAAESFLATGEHVGMGAPVGQAGNGAAMRTAALGLWFGNDHDDLVDVVADVSRLTHQDSRSVAGGIVVAQAANLLAHSDLVEVPREFCATLANSCANVNNEFADLLNQLPEEIDSTSALDFIAAAGQAVPEFERPIISPFVIPTVLAALYALLKHSDSWIESVVVAIRLGGDVDTLGAIVGALAGVRHGAQAIPVGLVEDLQDADYIRVLAERYHALIDQRGQ